MSELSWFAVRTQPQAERRVRAALKEQGLDHYLPLETKWSRRSRSKTRVDAPLFASYIFVGLDDEMPQFHLVHVIDGFLGFVGNNRPRQIQFYKLREVGKVEPFSIEGLQEAETLGAFDSTQSKKIVFMPGQTVRIVGGQFRGRLAEIIEAKSEARRVRLLVDALGGGKMTMGVDKIEHLPEPEL